MIGSYFFTRFQVASRDLHESDKELYANVFRMKSGPNLATIWFTSMQNEIQIVVQGTHWILAKF